MSLECRGPTTPLQYAQCAADQLGFTNIKARIEDPNPVLNDVAKGLPPGCASSVISATVRVILLSVELFVVEGSEIECVFFLRVQVAQCNLAARTLGPLFVYNHK